MVQRSFGANEEEIRRSTSTSKTDNSSLVISYELMDSRRRSPVDNERRQCFLFFFVSGNFVIKRNYLKQRHHFYSNILEFAVGEILNNMQVTHS